MGKRIIVLSDGTGNSAANFWRTNVWRLFESLDLRQSDQIAVYDDGVGTSSFKPLAILGGAFGFGLKRNVLGLYKFLCRNYKSKKDYEKLAKLAPPKPEDAGKAPAELKDDELFLFGFSRGAFTVRVLTGLVLSQGLVNFGPESELDRNARAAYRAYRATRYSGWNLEGPFRFIRNLLASHTHKINRPVDRIRFIGVWDTVAAYGSPIEEMTIGFSKYIWPLELPTHDLSDRVDRARHALAIDEERTSFAPELWNESPSVVPPNPKQEKLLQVWFSGVHANVGGGYPDDSLANVSLNWMMAEAADYGLRFKAEPAADPDAVKRVSAAQDKDGRLYDSRAGLGGYYRYGPRKIADLYAGASDDKNAGSPLPKIHESVFERTKVGAHLYAPMGLPDKYAVVRMDDRAILPLGTDTAESPVSAAKRHAEQESVWNVVWRRRAIYFLTVFVSLYTVVYPLIRESYAYQEMATRLRIVSDTIKLVGGFLPSAATRWLDGYARDPARFMLWAGAIGFLIWYGSSLKSDANSRMRRIWDAHLPGTSRAQPAASGGAAWTFAWWVFIFFLIYVAVYPVFELHSLLEYLKLPEPWNSLVEKYSEQPMRFFVWAFLVAHFLPENAIEKLRTWWLYRETLSFLKFKLFPLGFAVLIAYGAVAITSHLLFNVRDSWGSFCSHSTNDKGPLNAGNTGFECTGGKCSKAIDLFDSSVTDARSLCLPTGVFAERGKKYAIGVHRVPEKEKWTFWNEASFMSGQPVSRLEGWKQPILAMMFPFRRTLDRPWGAFIVRYGPTGTEESFLDRDPPPLDDDLVNPRDYKAEDVPANRESLGEEWTAKRDGEIYVYLNKPVMGFPWLETWISEKLVPNTGTARINIERR